MKGKPLYVLVDGKTGKELSRIEDPNAYNIECCGILPLPGFDPLYYPYFLVRNATSILIINIRLAKV